IDFMRVSDRTTVHTEVPVHFVNLEAAPGIKIGGVLNVVRHTVEIVCRADRIPDQLSLDLTGAEIGESLRMSAIALPEGAHPVVRDRDFVIATIAAPSAVRSEAAAEAAAEASAAD